MATQLQLLRERLKYQMLSLINSKEDMKWLRDVHLPKLETKYSSAIIEGNEDSPDAIIVYERANPLMVDLGVRYEDLQGFYEIVED